MRIIAGSAKGRTILAPKGQDTRPTQDYVRESLFNILQHDVPDANVLDLFAGSGALSLEAISRGANHATLNDLSQDALTCIRHNVEVLHFEEQVTFMRGDWLTSLRKVAQQGERFSLVFLDPPYRMTDTDQHSANIADLGLLEEDALIVIEHRRDHTPRLDSRFAQCDARRYGDTEIHFYRYGGGATLDE